MPYFIRHAFADTPGVMGFYVATLFSASLSTVSSGINSLAANTVEDILSGPLSSVKEHRVTQITKLIVCVYGAITVGLAYVANNMKGSVSQMALSVMGATGGPILGVFLVGASVPWINKYGVLGGGCLSIAFSVWIALGNQVYSKKSNNLPFAYTGQCEANITCPLGSDGVTCDTSTLLFTNDTSFHGNYSVEVPTYTTTSPYLTTNGTILDSGDFGFFLYDISYVWYALIGAVVSSVGAMAISFVSRKLVEKKTDPALMFPFSRKLWSMNVSKPTEEETEKSLATKDTVI
ncbi:sodium-coupled monocarboxylate transporter 1-like [Aplysia californica]|uniref:Sodium-coupled monocarboxylate transporter 1-like n=1 Tax=Aplysia californica TaxID=6500 RepID=A0ABM1VW65_APLCA|nr:sodium-coupled monocarboxylate transporter 1-like [Aplysia californica]